MSILIEIKSTHVQSKTVTRKADGKQFTFKEQTGWAHLVGRDGTANPYPERITLSLDMDNPVPYPEGSYTLAPSSFYKDAFGALIVSPRLVPAKTRAAS